MTQHIVVKIMKAGNFLTKPYEMECSNSFNGEWQILKWKINRSTYVLQSKQVKNTALTFCLCVCVCICVYVCVCVCV